MSLSALWKSSVSLILEPVFWTSWTFLGLFVAALSLSLAPKEIFLTIKYNYCVQAAPLQPEQILYYELL